MTAGDNKKSENEMKTNNKTIIGPVLIILAGCFWGSMGIFVRKLGTVNAYVRAGNTFDSCGSSNFKFEVR